MKSKHILCTGIPEVEVAGIDKMIAIRADMISSVQRGTLKPNPPGSAPQVGKVRNPPTAGEPLRAITIITLINNGHFLVEESVQEVVDKIKKARSWF